MNQIAPPTLADQRVADILSAAKHVFGEKGFEAASMHDLAGALGMSAGNFYRYFPSKSAIVEALIADRLGEMERDFAVMVQQPVPLSALREMIAAKLFAPEETCNRCLWAEMVSMSLRKAEIAALIRQVDTTIVNHLVTLFAHVGDVDFDTAFRRWAAHARLIVMLVQSYTVHHSELPKNNDLENLILRQINGLLDEISLNKQHSE